ncbi:MAG: hypothetical protein EOP06_01600 [Proteobacteria bacterium]|nr:MAG: hypothetical protein EOP06_01600 [Pseudomonadota bacterium]
MIRRKTSKLWTLMVTLSLLSCKESSSSEIESMLGSKSAPEASAEKGDKKVTAEAKSEEKLDKETVTLTKIEWAQKVSDLGKCEALAKESALSVEAQIAASYAKGKREVEDAMAVRISEVNSRVESEISNSLSDMEGKLKLFSSRAALVNGLCRADMVNGERRDVNVVNGCMNLVRKEVSNDGSIIAVKGAVAYAASVKGIKELDCRIGEATVSFLPKVCDQKMRGTPILTK